VAPAFAPGQENPRAVHVYPLHLSHNDGGGPGAGRDVGYSGVKRMPEPRSVQASLTR